MICDGTISLSINQSGAKDFNPFLKKNDLEKGIKLSNRKTFLHPCFQALTTASLVYL